MAKYMSDEYVCSFNVHRALYSLKCSWNLFCDNVNMLFDSALHGDGVKNEFVSTDKMIM